MIYEGLSRDALADRLGSPNVILRESVDSTLDVVHALAIEGAPAATVVLADEQLRGRGRLGRAWQSPKGAGIWLGFLHRPVGRHATGVFSLRVGLAVTTALDALGVTSRIKWPNDIILADRKLAGILCEAQSDETDVWVAVGVGMNVHGPMPAGLAQATALDDHYPGVGRTAVLERLVPALLRLSDDPVLAPEEHRALLAADWLRGRELSEPVPGTAAGIDPDGTLLVETATGVERVVAGTVVTR